MDMDCATAGLRSPWPTPPWPSPPMPMDGSPHPSSAASPIRRRSMKETCSLPVWRNRPYAAVSEFTASRSKTPPTARWGSSTGLCTGRIKSLTPKNPMPDTYPMKVQSFVEGQWREVNGSAVELFHAVTGEQVGEVSSVGLDFEA